MFDLEKAIKEWKLNLRKNPGYEDGDIEELESHLLDEIEHLQKEGLSIEEAFLKALNEIGEANSVGTEFYKTRSIKNTATPPWQQKAWIPSLLPNYMKIGFRNLYRDSGNSFINIFGLSMALICCIVIFSYVRQELTFDNFHENPDQIYRLTFQEINRPGARHFATTSPPMGPALLETYPEVEEVVRFRFVDSNIIQHEDMQFYEYDVAYADSSFLTMFNFPLKQGNANTALDEINSVILTSEMAEKYFGEENPIGKSLTLDNITTLTVTGVLAPIQQNTHLKFDCIISFHSFSAPPGYPVTVESWGWVSFYTYVRLRDGTKPEELEAKFKDFLVTNMGSDVGENRILHLQPLSEVYLNSDLQNASTNLLTGNRGYILGMSAVAAFLLLIACFNFMNLSTAQSIRRGKEVGVRKTLGARRSGLVRQFLGESILMAFLSVILAIIFVIPFSRFVSSLLGMELGIYIEDFRFIVPVFLVIGLLLGIISGLYPALVMSSFKPTKVLKGDFFRKKSSFDIRTVLVVAQFSIAILLITGSFIIREQIQFIQQRDLGFEQDQIVVLHMDGRELTRRYDLIRQQIQSNPNVINAGMGGGLLDGDNGSVPIFSRDAEDEEGYPMNIYGAHFGYFETMGIEFIKGRGFNESYSTDATSGIILNEAAAAVFGWDDPIGKHIQVDQITEGQIIGVTRNFNFASLHREIQPLVMYIPPTNMENLFVRVRPGNANTILTSLEQTWQEAVPDFPFHFRFLDEHLDEMYQADQRFFKLVTAFTILTILIACLGLYGLISYFILQRTKEIGIRKVLGASVLQIAFLLSKKFIFLVAIANLIAWPATWYLMQNWMQNFAYQIDVNLFVYLISGLIALGIAWLTMSYKSIKAALMNPVKSLKSE
ncbi:MAG: ABC transporter permease [Balneolaceae bacterium]|nr:ABC transporter permease [Balneolaceae bacterium]MBO6546026.1 ABC transporter permease [Balneolaceae bacterium]MBO6647422.1 ABC transporter permease [Balneolaceae bacterium]